MGSLLTAVASFLDIKQQSGQWYVRIEDLDPPRQDTAAVPAIMTTLDAHGLVGDLAVDLQSNHFTRYEQSLQKISTNVFYCDCPRRKLASFSLYPGTCRHQQTLQEDSAMRLHASGLALTLRDQIRGTHEFTPEIDFGDFIIKRRDGLWAYNFATAIDDGTDVTHVMRGEDLFHVTPPQIYAMRQLGLTQPTYAHLPVLCYADGTKLSKQTHAPALDNTMAADNLRTAMDLLGLCPPEQPQWHVSEWLSWGLEHWSLQYLPNKLKPFVEA